MIEMKKQRRIVAASQQLSKVTKITKCSKHNDVIGLEPMLVTVKTAKNVKSTLVIDTYILGCSDSHQHWFQANDVAVLETQKW